MFKEYACRNYPTIQHQSYGRCDRDFVEEECKIIGLVPFWATDNLKNVTLKALKTSGHRKLLPLLEGTRESNCVKPCKFEYHWNSL